MRIAVDARTIVSDDQGVRPRGGVGRYTYRLLSHLLSLDPGLDVRLIVSRHNTRPIFPAPPCRLQEVAFADRPSPLETQYRLARAVDLRDRELYHSPFQILPAGLPCRRVVTIHDLMWLTEPSLCAGFLPERWLLGTLYRHTIRHALRAADHVLTVSHASRREIERHAPRCQGRVTVTYHGLDPFFVTLPRAAAQLALGGLIPPDTRFVLCVGQGSPYKNHPRAVAAFLSAFEDQPAVKLVLVRRFSRIDPWMWSLRYHPALRQRLILLPSVSDTQLRALYNLAHIFFFPSLKEGFGMPLLEAMACGSPVLTSDVAVCREIARDAALLADPASIAGLAAALRRLDRDHDLRRELRAKARQRLQDFCWETSAKLTLRAYREAIRSSQGLP